MSDRYGGCVIFFRRVAFHSIEWPIARAFGHNPEHRFEPEDCSRVPGVSANFEGGRSSSRIVEVKGTEAQSPCREAGSEGSVKMRCGPTDRN